MILKFSFENRITGNIKNRLRNHFAVNPWVFGIGSNVVIIFIITTIGFGWMSLFNTVSIKMYADHCVYDNDCATDMNYICQNGKCGCTSTTFYLSASSGCGMIKILKKK